MNKFFDEVNLIILLKCIIVIWLLKYLIIDKLWVINKIVKFKVFCRFFSKLMIWVWIDMLSVLIGLFVINNLGLIFNVLVILICWCCLFENLCG